MRSLVIRSLQQLAYHPASLVKYHHMLMLNFIKLALIFTHTHKHFCVALLITVCLVELGMQCHQAVQCRHAVLCLPIRASLTAFANQADPAPEIRPKPSMKPK